MIELAREMGITTWNNPKDYGLSLTLGGGAVTGMDLAKSYAVIANGGKSVELNPILQVKDYKGRVIQTKSAKTNRQIVDQRVAYQIIDILKDNHARSPEFGLNSYLVIKDHPEVAVKTGTSNDLRDNWTVGFNQDYLVLTWVGNNDNSPMKAIASGITGASPIWNKIMGSLLKDRRSEQWRIPYGLIELNCHNRKEYFLQENIDPNFCKILPTPLPSGQVPHTIAPQIM
jgi:membrane carboxypeptidase/penicillin-binding protein PbpC